MVRVEPQTLRTKADQIGADLPHVPDPPSQPADGTQIASHGVKQLAASGHKFQGYSKSGQREAKRLSESYTAAAKAYEVADQETADALAHGEDAPTIKPVPVNTHHLSPPIPVPSDFAGVETFATPSFVTVEQFAEQLEQEHLGGFDSFETGLHDYATGMSDRSHGLTDAGQVWDGQAAEAAHNALSKHRQWTNEMGKSAIDLAQHANALAKAHSDAKAAHPTVAECKQAIHNLAQAMQQGLPTEPYIEAYRQLQIRSDEIQTAYANAATVRSIDPPKPPTGAPGLGPVSHNDPKGANAPGSGNGNPPGGGGGGGTPQGGDGASQGGQPETAPASPMSGGEQPESGKQPSSSGGSPSGGSPSGGSGSPSGGSGSGGGMPSLPGGDPSKDMPSLPDGPGLNPAAADGAGGGGSGGGGSGGGGGGAMPLQPAASGPALGTSPSSGGAGGHPAAASAGGGMAGGMGGGGGMPMGGHGQGGGGGKEKRRTPGLTPDEVIYTEDREWTENYIGQQAKRRTPADGKDSK
jgi:ESX-1 secreted protein B PE domain/PPE family